jgi:hypothetical protein
VEQNQEVSGEAEVEFEITIRSSECTSIRMK